MSLPSWASAFQESILAFTWRQWCQVGVAGARPRPDSWCQDPEALLLFSLEVTRLEPRAFDEILDWMTTNQQAVMVHRVKHLLAHDPDLPRNVVEAALERTGVLKAGRTSAERAAATSLFPMFDTDHGKATAWDPVFLRHGLRRPPFQPSGKSQAIRLALPVAYAFKLRAVFGASARAEALRYLLLQPGHRAGTAQIAEAALLTRFGVQQALEELHLAGLVRRGARGKKDLVWWTEAVHPPAWLLPGTGQLPGWVNWPSVFRGLAIVWRWVADPRRAEESPYILASGARAAMAQALPFLRDQGLAWRPEPTDGVMGAAYLDVFLRELEGLARALNDQEASTPVSYESPVDAIAHRPFASTRTLEVVDGQLALGNVMAGARNLAIHWNAFGKDRASLQVVDAPPVVLESLMGRVAGRLIDRSDLGRFEGHQEGGRQVSVAEVMVRRLRDEYEAGATISNLEIDFHQVSLGPDAEARTGYLRFLLANLDLDLWPQFSAAANGNLTRDSLSFHYQSRTVHLTALQKEPAVAALVLEGDFPGGDALAFANDVATVFSFLADVPVQVLAMEAYDTEARVTSEVLFSVGASVARPRRVPIWWHSSVGGNVLLASRMAAVVSTLMERYMALKGPLDLPAVVGSLSGVRGVPIELEILVKIAVIKKMARTWASQAGRTRKAVDVWRFFDSLQVPLDASVREIVAEQLRAADDGDLLSTAPDTEALQGKVQALGVLTTVANACLLRMLGYYGPLVDYGRAGYPNLELEPISTS